MKRPKNVTQDIEESVAVPDKKKEDKQQPEPEKKTQPKPEVDNRIKNQVANAFSKGNTGSNRGTSDRGLEQKEARTEIVLPVLNTALPVTEIMIWAVEV